MNAGAESQSKPGLGIWLIGMIKAVAFGTILGMSAATSVLSLGWLTRRMRAQALLTAGLHAEPVGWILGSRGQSFLARLLGGLAANIRAGVLMAFSLGLAAFPFATIWSLSWWAGWENSFSKGYEQAFVGPALGLSGVLLFCLIMVWHPMAMAHQAVENRLLALFEWRCVRSAVRHAGFGYFWLAIVSVLFSLPLFAGRGLVVFASGLIPGFDTISPQGAADLATGLLFLKAGYAFVALMILRGWAAKIYANAVGRALDGPDAELWQDSPLAAGRRGGRRPWKLTHWVRVLLLSIVWFGLVAQIYIGQFLNNDWHIWLTHPVWFLPWPG